MFLKFTRIKNRTTGHYNFFCFWQRIVTSFQYPTNGYDGYLDQNLETHENMIYNIDHCLKKSIFSIFLKIIFNRLHAGKTCAFLERFKSSSFFLGFYYIVSVSRWLIRNKTNLEAINSSTSSFWTILNWNLKHFAFDNS